MIIKKWADGYIRLYSLEERKEWNAVVKSFANWDIYYLSEYAYSFMVHGDGEPILIEYKDKETHFCYAVMKKDISDCAGFCGRLEKNRYFDLETPYGYGGPLSDDEIPDVSQKRFLSAFSEYCLDENIVSQFIRFHPLLGNHMSMSSVIETRYMHDTIYMDTSVPDVIWANMSRESRNRVRKAISNGITVACVPISEYADFYLMYKETMEKDEAADYYLFKEDYFKSLASLRDNACIFYAMLGGKPISGAIIYYSGRFLHYHLGGTHTEYRQYSPNNLLFYEAACWGAEHGMTKFHLGGGMSPEDNLFKFKMKFNKNGRLPFVIGRTIFDYDSYDKLLQIRKSLDSSFDMENDRMIQYRK